MLDEYVYSFKLKKEITKCIECPCCEWKNNKGDTVCCIDQSIYGYKDDLKPKECPLTRLLPYVSVPTVWTDQPPMEAAITVSNSGPDNGYIVVHMDQKTHIWGETE